MSRFSWPRITAGPPTGRRSGPLVDDRPHVRRLRPGEQLLALEPQAYPPVDLVGRRGHVAEQGDGARVLLRLEEAVHELQLEGADDRSGRFQAQVRLEPVGRDVAVLGPPARCVGLPGKRHHGRPRLLVGDAVEGEQVCNVSLLEPHPAVLHAADLGPGCADGVTRPFGGNTRGLAKAMQLIAQNHARYCRPDRVASRVAVWRNPAHSHPEIRQLHSVPFMCKGHADSTISPGNEITY
jgi:hypothetical protein